MIFFVVVVIVNTKTVATEHSYRLLQCTGGYCDPCLKFMSGALVCSLSATALSRLLDK